MSHGAYRTPAERDPDEPPVDPAKPWALQTWASRRTCPTCRVGLFALRKEGWRVDACGACGGAWLPRAEAERMLSERSPVPANLSMLARERATKALATRPGAPCPDCGLALVPTKTSAGPTVDACAAHGTWLDAGELEAVARPFAGLVLPAAEDVPDARDADTDGRRLGREGKLNAILRSLAGRGLDEPTGE